MEGFSRAYRDPRSPLAPLTPLSINNVFSFRLGGDDSLNTWIEQIDSTRQKRNSNSCGLQSRHLTSPNNACGLQSKSSPNNSTRFSNVSSSTTYSKSPRCNTASTMIASCLIPRYSASKFDATTPTKSGVTTKHSAAANTTHSSYKTPCSANKSLGSNASHYNTANSSTGITSHRSSTSTSYANGNTSASRYGCVATSTSKCVTTSSSSNSSASSRYLTAANSSRSTGSCGCGCRRAPPKIVIEGKKYAEDKPSGSSSMFDWICEQLTPSPSPRKKGAITMGDCLYALLSNFGMEKYWTLFEREEIDMDVFRTLTYNDLNTLGITNDSDCKGLINAVTAAHNLSND